MKDVAFHLPAPLEIAVADAELARLIGWPRNRPFRDGTAELVCSARRIFAESARPWHHARQVPIAGISADQIELHPNITLPGRNLATKADAVQADAVVVFAATAGWEIIERSNELMKHEPELAFILSSLGSAFVEQSLLRMHESLCAWAAPHQRAVLNPMSPGNEDWDLSAQQSLFSLIEADPELSTAPPIALLPSDTIAPSLSLLAVSLLTPRLDLAQSQPGFRPCTQCSLRGCVYRRAAFVDSVP